MHTSRKKGQKCSGCGNTVKDIWADKGNKGRIIGWGMWPLRCFPDRIQILLL